MKFKESTNVLLMTATITPISGERFLSRTDPAIRLKDYENALIFYSSLIGKQLDSIVFVENSNSDITTLKKLVEDRNLQSKVEFIVFNGLDYPAKYSRAYGEFKLIDYGVENSKTIQSAGDNLVVWKVTGRYIVKNLDQIIRHQPRRFDLYCNFRKIPKPWTDMFLLAWTAKGYESCIQGLYPQLKTDYDAEFKHPEEMFIEILQGMSKDVKIFRRFKQTPRIDGVKGADNQNYLKGRNLLKFRLRALSNRVFPWIWI
jgi:hypothetical protein